MAKSIGTNDDFRTLSELVPKKSYIKKRRNLAHITEFLQELISEE